MYRVMIRLIARGTVFFLLKRIPTYFHKNLHLARNGLRKLGSTNDTPVTSDLFFYGGGCSKKKIIILEWAAPDMKIRTITFAYVG